MSRSNMQFSARSDNDLCNEEPNRGRGVRAGCTCARFLPNSTRRKTMTESNKLYIIHLIV